MSQISFWEPWFTKIQGLQGRIKKERKKEKKRKRKEKREIILEYLISQITVGNPSSSPLPRLHPAVSVFNIARQMEEAIPFLSRDPSNIGKMAATLVATALQRLVRRPVEFPSISRFFPAASAGTGGRGRGSNIDSDISTGILFASISPRTAFSTFCSRLVLSIFH